MKRTLSHQAVENVGIEQLITSQLSRIWTHLYTNTAGKKLHKLQPGQNVSVLELEQ